VRSRYIIDNPDVYVGGGEITGLSCGDAGWCVAVDTRGSVLAQYQTPIGGWHTTEYVDGHGLAAVSCTPTFCLAANGDGGLFPNQATHGGAWPRAGSGDTQAGHDAARLSNATVTRSGPPARRAAPRSERPVAVAGRRPACASVAIVAPVAVLACAVAAASARTRGHGVAASATARGAR
jgi:hypothetical protein